VPGGIDGVEHPATEGCGTADRLPVTQPQRHGAQLAHALVELAAEPAQLADALDYLALLRLVERGRCD